jgi:hypothetical protein
MNERACSSSVPVRSAPAPTTRRWSTRFSEVTVVSQPPPRSELAHLASLRVMGFEDGDRHDLSESDSSAGDVADATARS